MAETDESPAFFPLGLRPKSVNPSWTIRWETVKGDVIIAKSNKKHHFCVEWIPRNALAWGTTAHPAVNLIQEGILLKRADE
jgi:hypothetical protein